MYFLHVIYFINIIVLIRTSIYEILINMAKTSKVVYISSIWDMFAH